MSIPLTQILELSHQLYLGRKRQADWESRFEKRSRREGEVPADVSFDLQETLKDTVYSDEIAEMKILRDDLRSKGSAPRDPDTETALLNLWSAAAAAKDAVILGSNTFLGDDFEWMIDANFSLSSPVLAQEPAKDETVGVQTFAKLRLPHTPDLNINVASSSSSRVDDFCDFTVNAEKQSPQAPKARLQKGLERLCVLLKPASVLNPVSSKKCRLCECDDDEQTEMLKMLQEMSRKVMLEVEREELNQMLGETMAGHSPFPEKWKIARKFSSNTVCAVSA
jgi:hypothetical protein